jgi:glycerol-3-phosphate acyltransferase PlsY
MRLNEDIRELGSGSVGARNVGRVLGKTGFLLTLLSDFGKGSFAVWAARHFTTDDRIVALAMISVIAGHIWPMQLRFRGGKGMATSLGALLVYDPRLALAVAVLFLCAFALLWRTILPGLFALACVPLVSLIFDHTSEKIVLVSIAAGLVLLAHRKNFMEEILNLGERRDAPSHINRTRL